MKGEQLREEKPLFLEARKPEERRAGKGKGIEEKTRSKKLKAI